MKRLEGNAENTKCGGKKYRRIEIPEIPVYGATANSRTEEL